MRRTQHLKNIFHSVLTFDDIKLESKLSRIFFFLNFYGLFRIFYLNWYIFSWRAYINVKWEPNFSSTNINIWRAENVIHLEVTFRNGIFRLCLALGSLVSLWFLSSCLVFCSHYQLQTCSCPFEWYFRTLFWDNITIICWWKLSKQTSYWSKNSFFFLS